MPDFLAAGARRAVFERYLTRKEERALFAAIAKHAGVYARRDHAWMRLLRFTGIRLGTLCGLTADAALDMVANRRLVVADDNAKGGVGYELPLNKAATAALRDLLKVRREMGAHDDDGGPLVLSRQGKGISERSLQHAMQKWRTAAGLSVKASPHWLRHTLAMRVLAATDHRDPQGVVQVALGHRSRASTVVYTLPSREDVARALESSSR
jgi:site-specific recombinase XerC